MSNTPFKPLKNRQFRNLWCANLGTNMGWHIHGVSAAWIMTTLSPSPYSVAMVQASITLPIAAFSLLGGVLADSYERRKVMIFSQWLVLAASGGLALLTWTGIATVPVILLCTFLVGCGAATHIPSWMATAGDLFAKKDLPQAVMLNGIGFNLSRSIGPALGGMLVAFLGTTVTFVIVAVGYIPALATLLFWKTKYQPDNLPREPISSAISAGPRYVSLSPGHLTTLLRAAIFGFSTVALLALMPLISQQLLQGSSISYGALLGCFGLGAVCNALVIHKLRSATKLNRIVVAAAVLTGFSLLGMALAPNFFVISGCAFAAGMSWQASMSLFNLSVQMGTPRWILGRAMSLLQAFSFGGMTLGSLTWGWVATKYNVEAALICGAAISFAGATLGLFLKIPEVAQQDLTPSKLFSPPDPVLDISMSSGPIKVSVEYTIPPEETERFLGLMAVRRGIRLRDGARAWSLFRDLTDTAKWHESYRVPTWAAYLRHLERRTTADAENFRDLSALQSIEQPPASRQWIERPASVKEVH
jgi:MFS family permease